jgi:hypothetical protein
MPVTPFEQAILDALDELTDEEDTVPAMQLLQIRIGGVDYQCFSSVISEEDEEIPKIEAIQIGDIIPMYQVIAWLEKAQDSWLKGHNKELQ